MKEWANDKLVVCGSDKWQEIRYTYGKGEEPSLPYVRYRNQRIYLDEFFTSPHGFQEESNLCGIKIHAVCTTSMFTAFLIHINNEGDMAKVFYSYTK